MTKVAGLASMENITHICRDGRWLLHELRKARVLCAGAAPKNPRGDQGKRCVSGEDVKVPRLLTGYKCRGEREREPPVKEANERVPDLNPCVPRRQIGVLLD